MKLLVGILIGIVILAALIFFALGAADKSTYNPFDEGD